MQTSGKLSLKSWLPRHWWQVLPVARALRDGTLTEQEKFAYVFVWFWVGALGYLIIGWEIEAEARSVWALAGQMIGEVILVVGVFCSFRINQAGDNRNYLERLGCLFFPIAVQSGVYFGMLAVILSEVGEMAGWSVDWFDLLFGLLLYPIIVWRLCRWMRWVAQGTSDPVNGDASKT